MTTTTQPYVAQEHQQLAWLGDSRVSVVLSGDRTNGALTVMSSVLAAGDASPLHVHSREDEVFLLLSGRAAVWVGNDRYEVGPGGVAFLPRDLPHAYHVLEDDTQMLTLCTPGGLEGFFRSAGQDLSAPVPEGWTLGPAELAPAAAAHGVTLLGPPPVA